MDDLIVLDFGVDPACYNEDLFLRKMLQEFKRKIDTGSMQIPTD